MKATVVGIYGAYYEVRPGDDRSSIVLAKTRGKLRLTDRTTSYFEPGERHLLTIGDEVEIRFSGDDRREALITALYPRRNSYQRATNKQKQTLGANLDGVIIFTSLDYPPFNNGLLTRLLLEACLSRIDSIVVLNKMDYRESENKALYDEVLEKVRYLETIGVKVFFESIRAGISQALRERIQKGRYLAFGESGVGKSSFINQMAGRKLQIVDPDSIELKGRHVTTNPVLYEIAGEVELIDVPGIREFGLMHRSPADISAGFPEFAGLRCRFSNCVHMNEPGCGIKDMVATGKIPAFRYTEYANIINGMGEKWKPRRGDYRLPGKS